MLAPTTQRSNVSTAKPPCVRVAQAIARPSASKTETHSPYETTGIDVKPSLRIATV